MADENPVGATPGGFEGLDTMLEVFTTLDDATELAVLEVLEAFGDGLSATLYPNDS